MIGRLLTRIVGEIARALRLDGIDRARRKAALREAQRALDGQREGAETERRLTDRVDRDGRP